MKRFQLFALEAAYVASTVCLAVGLLHAVFVLTWPSGFTLFKPSFVEGEPVIFGIALVGMLVSNYLLGFPQHQSTPPSARARSRDGTDGNGGSGEFVAELPTTTFDDVVGCEEAKTEMRDIVAFLREPDAYGRLGAKPPRGILFHGPPGTGKTLLARAVAGEAGVSFLHAVGSDFIEKWVGVGASRVRELFERAKSQAPCIVFIDEVDAVGGRRPDRPVGGENERAQTLNALLACLDGFASDPKAPAIIFLAATNRPDVLDPAFVRPGRIDRTVCVPMPGPNGRRSLFHLHAKDVRVAETVDIDWLSGETSGMSGAQIANVVNEAARIATRRSADAVEAADFRDAFDTVQIGGRREDRTFTAEVRRRTAHHEIGHAILAAAGGVTVRSVTILPRGNALGANRLGEDDDPTLAPSDVHARIAMLLGGHAAEELRCNGASLGSEQDLVQANRLIDALHRAGRSTTWPLVTFDEGRGLSWSSQVDERSRTLVAMLAHAKAVLEANRALHDELLVVLLARETLLENDLRPFLSRVKRETPSV